MWRVGGDGVFIMLEVMNCWMFMLNMVIYFFDVLLSYVLVTFVTSDTVLYILHLIHTCM